MDDKIVPVMKKLRSTLTIGSKIERVKVDSWRMSSENADKYIKQLEEAREPEG